MVYGRRQQVVCVTGYVLLPVVKHDRAGAAIGFEVDHMVGGAKVSLLLNLAWAGICDAARGRHQLLPATP